MEAVPAAPLLDTEAGGLPKLLIVALVLSINNFGVALAMGGLGMRRSRVRIGLVFGAFEFLMPLAGLLAGQAAADWLLPVSNWLAPSLIAGLHASEGLRTAPRRGALPARHHPGLAALVLVGSGTGFMVRIRPSVARCVAREAIPLRHRCDLRRQRVPCRSSSASASRMQNTGSLSGRACSGSERPGAGTGKLLRFVTPCAQMVTPEEPSVTPDCARGGWKSKLTEWCIQ